MKTLCNVLLIGLLGFAISGCASESFEPTTFDTGHWPIVFGDPAPSPDYDSVVGLNYSDDLAYLNYCTGTYIADGVVLTAAHCLDAEVNPRSAVPMSPDEILIYVGEGPPDPETSTYYAVSRVLIHPEYSKKKLTNDIGLLELTGPIDGLTPIPALPASLGFEPGDEGVLPLDFAGFGMDEYGDYDVRLHLVGELDHIESSTEIYYYQYEGGPCFGDSGGPAIVTRVGQWYVGGITSYGDNQCSVYGVSTRVDAYEAWINDFVGIAYCETDADCTDGICCNGDCVTPICSSDSDCGAGTFCPADVCQDAGTCSARCVEEWPICDLDSSDLCCAPDCDDMSDADCEEPVACLGKKEPCMDDYECCSGNCVNGFCRGE